MINSSHLKLSASSCKRLEFVGSYLLHEGNSDLHFCLAKANFSLVPFLAEFAAGAAPKARPGFCWAQSRTKAAIRLPHAALWVLPISKGHFSSFNCLLRSWFGFFLGCILKNLSVGVCFAWNSSHRCFVRQERCCTFHCRTSSKTCLKAMVSRKKMNATSSEYDHS